MALSLNKVTLIGNVGRDPEVRFMPDGSKVVSFSLATGESWKDKTTGERKERTEWHKIVAFSDRLADMCEKFVKKGSKLYIEGQLQTREWTDSTGARRFTTEIVISRFKGDIIMMDPPKRGEASQADHDAVALEENRDEAPLDDDIPF